MLQEYPHRLPEDYPKLRQVKIAATTLNKWQRIVDVLAEILGVSQVRLVQAAPTHLKVLVESRPVDSSDEPARSTLLGAGSYCETVVAEGVRLFVPNARLDSRWEHGSDCEAGMLAYLGLPLAWPTGEIFGTLALLSSQENSIGDRHERVLRPFQESVQTDLLALHLAEREDEAIHLLAQKKMLENLLTVAQATVAHPTIEVTLQNAVDVSSRLTQADHGTLILLDRYGNVTYNLLSSERRPQVSSGPVVGLVLDKGVAGWVAKNFEMALINDTQADPRWLDYPGQPYQARSALVLPIVRGTTLLGILTLLHRQPHHFTAEHAELMQAATGQMALSLDNARLFTLTQQELAERRRAEEQLRQSEARYRAVSDLTSDYTFAFEVKPDGGMELEWVADAFTRITGYNYEEVQSRGGWLTIVYPDDLEIARQFLQNVVTGQHNVAEFRFLTKREEIRWVRTYGKPDWAREQGRVVRIFGAGQDITERKGVEDELQQAYRQLKDWLGDLEQHNREIALLNDMSDFFRACRTTKEAYEVVARFGSELFPTEMGSLLMISEARTGLNRVASWGFEPTPGEMYTPDDCWALRRGRIHQVEDTDFGLTCRHLSSPRPGGYLCIPMIAQSETLGLLCLAQTEKGGLSETKKRLAVTVSEQVALALANLRLHETLRTQSSRDSLTGLFNRRYMEESLERELHRAGRETDPLSVIMLDLDNFKRFNDTYGHEVGDTVLRELARLLQNHVRAEDIACRHGGEEFTLILPGLSLEDAWQRAEQIQGTVRQMSVYHQGLTVGSLTISQGVAVFPDHGLNSFTLLRAADAALYRAKNAGRDNVKVAGHQTSAS